MMALLMYKLTKKAHTIIYPRKKIVKDFDTGTNNSLTHNSHTKIQLKLRSLLLTHIQRYTHIYSLRNFAYCKTH